jgi:hypothetical protein
MVQMPPEMDPDEEPEEWPASPHLAAVRESLRKMALENNWPWPPKKRSLAEIHADLKASLESFDSSFPRRRAETGYAEILAALAKLQADVARSLEMLADLQARLPPPEPPPAP